MQKDKTLPEKVKKPYTAETFPCWAVWIRNLRATNSKPSAIIEHGDGSPLGNCVFGLECINNGEGIEMSPFMANFKDVTEWEIASSVPDEYGNTIWKPFYQTIKKNYFWKQPVTICHGLEYIAK